MSSPHAQLSEQAKREIGQHFVVGFVGQDVSEDVVSLIRDWHVGAIILMKRKIKDVRCLRRLVAGLQAVAKDAGHENPLLIGIDQENGLVSAFTTPGPHGGTQFPGAMALAAAGAPDLAERVGASTGREMKLAGVNWAFAPVCDVNSDPRNPVIGVRSFGDDPDVVASFAAAVARGLALAGVAPCAKHFPGHGDTHVDSHIGLPRILKTKAQLRATELVPFAHLVAGGVATVMTGHMALPLVVGDDTPCSLSRTITTDLLRGELGFDGVIVTDCLEMDAVVETCGAEEGAVGALRAGADVVMVCHRIERQEGAIRATYAAVKLGVISLSELEASGRRIRALKRRFAGSWDEVLSPDLDTARFRELKRASELTSGSAYARCVALLPDDACVLPLTPSPGEGERVFVLTPEMETQNRAVDDAEDAVRAADGTLRNAGGPAYGAFADAVSQRLGARATHVVYGRGDRPPAAVAGAAAVICATRGADRSGWQLEYLRAVLEAVEGGEARVVVLATLTPYELFVPPTGRGAAYLCCFEYTRAALDAAAAVIFGEGQARGRLPVRGGA